MLKKLTLAVFAITAAATLSYAGTLVDQGNPGRQGPWPVYIQGLPDGGGGISNSLWEDGGPSEGDITPVPSGGFDTLIWVPAGVDRYLGWTAGDSTYQAEVNATDGGNGARINLSSGVGDYLDCFSGDSSNGLIANNHPGCNVSQGPSAEVDAFWWDGSKWSFGSQLQSIDRVSPVWASWFYVDGGEPVATQSQVGWISAYDCNFVTQSNATWSDGTHTACGVTWTCENNANAATTTALIHGTGLQFKPNTTATTYTASTWTAPDCKFSIPSIASIEPDTSLRLCVQQVNTGANVGQDGFFGLSTVAQSGSNISIQFGYGSSATQAISASTTARGAGGSTNFNQLISVATYDTECVTASAGLFNRTTQSYGQLDAGLFDPALQTVFNTSMFDTSASQVWQGGSTTYPASSSAYTAFLGGLGASTSTATYTFKHVWLFVKK